MIEIPLYLAIMTGINYSSQLVFVGIFPPPINSTIWDSMDGYNFHFGPPGACFFGGGRQATYEKELRELREKLAKRQAYLEEGGGVDFCYVEEDRRGLSFNDHSFRMHKISLGLGKSPKVTTEVLVRCVGCAMWITEMLWFAPTTQWVAVITSSASSTSH